MPARDVWESSRARALHVERCLRQLSIPCQVTGEIGDITLNGIAMLDGSCSFNQTSGASSGPGGLTMIGTWSTSSFINQGVVSAYGKTTHTGPTIVKLGTLSLGSNHSLSDKTEVSLPEGAMLDLDFKGEMRVSKLSLDGKLQPAGTYRAKNAPLSIKGKGVLKNQS